MKNIKAKTKCPSGFHGSLTEDFNRDRVCKICGRNYAAEHFVELAAEILLDSDNKNDKELGKLTKKVLRRIRAGKKATQ